MAATLRFAGGLHIVGGQIVVEAELDTANAARRLRRFVAEVYGHKSDVLVMSARWPAQEQPLRRPDRRGGRDPRPPDRAHRLARPPGPRPAAEGRQRRPRATPRPPGEARSSPTARSPSPGRSSALEVTCPGPEAALALVGAARRLGIQAKAREVRGVDRVVIRDGDAIAAMLTRLGAHDAVLAWEERRMRREVRATANRLANFDDANLRRSARAAVAAGSRVERAMEILGDDVPDHLGEAGQLRLKHKQASLEELGQLANPPMTKDAVAGRIRRLLAMADKRAQDLGIPGTDANLTADMLEGGPTRRIPRGSAPPAVTRP